MTIHLGYYLGKLVQPYGMMGTVRVPAAVLRIVPLVLVAAIWVAGQIYVKR